MAHGKKGGWLSTCLKEVEKAPCVRSNLFRPSSRCREGRSVLENENGFSISFTFLFAFHAPLFHPPSAFLLPYFFFFSFRTRYTLDGSRLVVKREKKGEEGKIYIFKVCQSIIRFPFRNDSAVKFLTCGDFTAISFPLLSPVVFTPTPHLYKRTRALC